MDNGNCRCRNKNSEVGLMGFFCFGFIVENVTVVAVALFSIVFSCVDNLIYIAMLYL